MLVAPLLGSNITLNTMHGSVGHGVKVLFLIWEPPGLPLKGGIDYLICRVFSDKIKTNDNCGCAWWTVGKQEIVESH